MPKQPPLGAQPVSAKSTTPQYTQVNILFPPSEVELPSADQFNAFPEEAQKAILIGFRSEQMERHAWLRSQQRNDHDLNINAQRHGFLLQLTGTIGGTLIVLGMIISGTSLLKAGASAAGVAMIIVALAGLAGTAIYGHRAARGKDLTRREEAPKKGDAGE